MKKILFISLLCISAFIGNSQQLLINKYLKDTLVGSGWQIWHDSLHNGIFYQLASGSSGGSVNISNAALTADGNYEHDWNLKTLHIKNIDNLFLRNDETELANNHFKLGPYSLGLGSYLNAGEGDADITMGWGYDDLARRYVRTDLNAATGSNTSRIRIYGDSIQWMHHEASDPSGDFDYNRLMYSVKHKLYFNGDSLYSTNLFHASSANDSVVVWNPTTKRFGYKSASGITPGSIVNADVNASAAIAYSKLNLTGSIINADLVNSSVTVNGTAISLGASGTVTAAAGTLTGTTLNSTVVSSSLTSVGTIVTGVWNGTTVGVAYGGTGVTSITAKSIWVSNSANTITEVTPAAGQSVRINAGGTAWEAYTPGSGGMAIGDAITSATAGSILFAGTSGVLAQDNTNFFWDNTNDRLGIGTAVPNYDIEVNKTKSTPVTMGFWNAGTGTDSREYIIVGEGGSGRYVYFGHNNASYTTDGVYAASSGIMDGANTGGLYLGSSNASGSLKFFTGGSASGNVRMTISSGGDVSMAGSLSLTGSSVIDMSEITTPSTPASGRVYIYPKADGFWYGLDDAGIETKLSNDASTITKNAAFGMSAPTSSEDAMVFFTPIAITITNVQEALVGSSPSVTYTINYGSARNSATGTIVASHAATSTTGTAATLNVTSIPANSYIWITTSATSGTVNDWNVSISYK